LRQRADNLEKTVASRTAKLHETITELEHFSYAIVHDLRAPLRAMQSFADLLEEEAAECLQPATKGYLRRTKIASNRMDQLITDSLSYSKAARQEFKLLKKTSPISSTARRRGTRAPGSGWPSFAKSWREPEDASAWNPKKAKAAGSGWNCP